MSKLAYIILSLILLIFVLVGCGSYQFTPSEKLAQAPTNNAVVNTPLPPTALPTLLPPIATETLSITPTTLPSLTPTPSKTATPLNTSTPTLTPTPTATTTPTLAPTPTPTPLVNRACVDPGLPTYNRYWVSAEKYPTPIPNPQAHFILSKPLKPGVGRFLANQTYPYGYDGGRNYGLLLHIGVDVSEKLGSPVLAAADGVVVYAQSDKKELHGWRCNWYGHFVTILHDEQWDGQPVYTLYGHVLNMEVLPGERVKKGEQIAEVGYGGAAVAAHLHFEVRVGDNLFTTSRNPMLWVKPGVGRGVIAGRVVDPDGQPWQGVSIRAVSGDEDRRGGITWSYLGDSRDLARPDDGFAENFVFSDLKVGKYTLYTTLQGVEYSQVVDVKNQDVVTVEFVTEKLHTPTPVKIRPTLTPTIKSPALSPAEWAGTATAEAP